MPANAGAAARATGATVSEWYPHCRDRVAAAADPARQGTIRAVISVRYPTDPAPRYECAVTWDDAPAGQTFTFTALETLTLVAPRDG